MSFLMRQVAHCDVCGHEWLTSKVPIHCAKCKSRKWNQGDVPEINHISQEIAEHKYWHDTPEKGRIVSNRTVYPGTVKAERTVEYEE